MLPVVCVECSSPGHCTRGIHRPAHAPGPVKDGPMPEHEITGKRMCIHVHVRMHAHTHTLSISLSLSEVSSWNAASERPRKCGWGRGRNCLLRSCSALDFVNQDHEGRHWCSPQLGRIAWRVEEAVRGGRQCQIAGRCTHRIHSGCCPLILHKYLLFSGLSFSNFYHGNSGLEEFQIFLPTTEFHHT